MNFVLFYKNYINLSENFSKKSAGVDLALLSLADHSILTYGTFGMWGALLAGGDVIMPDKYSVTKEQAEIAAANLEGWMVL
jgi:galactoside 2-L-fucosyltransferase 1/2